MSSTDNTVTPEQEKTPGREETKAAPGQAAPGENCGCNDAQTPRMPEVTFTTFVLSIASSGLVQLGEVPDPQTGETQENLLMAKHTIDVLTMLRDKTRGGLDEDEHKLIEALLYELRMKYVLKAK